MENIRVITGTKIAKVIYTIDNIIYCDYVHSVVKEVK